MKNPNTKRKFRAVVKAAILGALVFDALLLVATVVFRICDHTPGNICFELSQIVDLFLLIPYMTAISITGYDGIFVSPFVVNGLLGAIIFAIFASCRQFICKKDDEIKS